MKVALLAETSRGYGREFLNGLAQFAQERGDWLLRLFSPDDLKGRRPFAGFDGIEYARREPLNDDVIFDERMGRNAADESLRRWVNALPSGTAVLCANDMRANQVCTIAAEDGIRVPQDLSLLGTDNDSFLCLFSSTPLSSIDPNAHGVGYAAARLLHAAIKKPPPHKKRQIFRVRPGKLVERSSTAFRPISPEWLSDALVFIDRNRFQPLSAAEVVARCNRSAHTVTKAFLKNFGLTPGRYITKIKMEEARRLVRLRTHSSKEIASLVGYSTPQYFCNAYRAYYGHSPFAPSARVFMVK